MYNIRTHSNELKASIYRSSGACVFADQSSQEQTIDVYNFNGNDCSHAELPGLGCGVARSKEAPGPTDCVRASSHQDPTPIPILREMLTAPVCPSSGSASEDKSVHTRIPTAFPTVSNELRENPAGTALIATGPVNALCTIKSKIQERQHWTACYVAVPEAPPAVVQQAATAAGALSCCWQPRHCTAQESPHTEQNS